MTETLLRKDELEGKLKSEHDMIKNGIIKDDAPLDTSPEFAAFCNACRRGDLKVVQEGILAGGVNINARDEYDYTPLILASLCGHYEVVSLLLESGALCERDTFSGERCLYNALTDKIRSLLLKYDYSKSTDPLQPLAAHITSLLIRQTPKTSDIEVVADNEVFHAHKVILAARSPYFKMKLEEKPETKQYKIAHTIPAEAFEMAFRYLYLGEVPSDLGLTKLSRVSGEEVLKGIDKMAKHLEIESLWDGILAAENRTAKRQRHQDEVNRGRAQLEGWFRDNVIRHKIVVDTKEAKDVKRTHDNCMFADVILKADAETEEEEEMLEHMQNGRENDTTTNQNGGNPVGPRDTSASNGSVLRSSGKSVLYSCHRAMLIRSDYFSTMFSSAFLEAQPSQHLRIITVDCSPEVLEIILTFLYTEKADFGLGVALEVLYTADMLLIEKLKNKAALIISTLGNGRTNALIDSTHRRDTTNSKGQDPKHSPDEEEEEKIDIYEVLRAGWDLSIQRLEEFAGRYFAYRLESYIDEPEFEEVVKESARRVKNRQETDTIEIIDDIRYYLSERFRLRFEDLGLNEMGRQIAVEAGVVKPTYNNNPTDNEKAAEEQLAKVMKKIELNGGVKDEGVIETLGGELADDEFSSDAINYHVLIAKLDALLERLNLEA